MTITFLREVGNEVTKSLTNIFRNATFESEQEAIVFTKALIVAKVRMLGSDITMPDDTITLRMQTPTRPPFREMRSFRDHEASVYSFSYNYLQGDLELSAVFNYSLASLVLWAEKPTASFNLVDLERQNSILLAEQVDREALDYIRDFL